MIMRDGGYDECLDLMHTLMAYRHEPIHSELIKIRDKYSMLHLDVLILIYHMAKICCGAVLEIGLLQLLLPRATDEIGADARDLREREPLCGTHWFACAPSTEYSALAEHVYPDGQPPAHDWRQ